MTDRDPRIRLMELVAAQGVSLSGLSALLGRNPSYLQQFVRKGSPRKLEENDRYTLARFFGVDQAELGDGAASDGAQSYIGRRYPPPAWVSVPRLAVRASAGQGALGPDELAVGHFQFEPRWLRSRGYDPAMLSMIEVEGDSMEPTLRDGDEILVDRTPRGARDGIHVIRLDGEALLVKRLAHDGDLLRLISDNPVYPEMGRHVCEVEVVGRVVWKGGRL